MKREYPALGVVFQTVVKGVIKQIECIVWKFTRKYKLNDPLVNTILNESNPLFKTSTIDKN